MDPTVLASLLALTALEIVLGIDNIVFIAIMVERLPKAKRAVAYRLGLGAALVSRLLLLLALKWVMGLKATLFRVLEQDISGRDVILILGGAFLVFKSSREIFDKVEGLHGDAELDGGRGSSMRSVVLQIMIIDIVFSLDSVITAVGIADEIWVMATAMVTAVVVMMLFAKRVGDFVNANPSMQILALSFLLLIGVLLLAEGFGQHISKGYVYFAMVFSLVVEVVQMRRRRQSQLAKKDDATPSSNPG